MKQEEIKEYLLKKDCPIYKRKQKEDSMHYFFRKNGFKKIVVLYPVKNNRSYRNKEISHIYETLNIDPPEGL